MDTLNEFDYFLPTKIIFGNSRIDEIGKVSKEFGSKALLVAGVKAMNKLGIIDRIINNLKSCHVNVVVYDGIKPNPDKESINKGAQIAKQERCEIVITIGGGSVLDSGKAIAIVHSKGGDVWKYIGENKIPGPVTPIIVIPTTAGTGSEVTAISVLNHTQERLKEPIISPYIFPKIAIVDPMLMVSMPPSLTANTGMDTLAHSIEAYVSRFSNPITDLLAIKACELCAKYLRLAVFSGKNLEARSGMALASILGGISAGHAGTGIGHALSQAIGAYSNVSHGAVVGILLPWAMQYNLSARLEKFEGLARAMGERRSHLSSRCSGSRAIDTVRKMVSDISLPTTLKEFGISAEYMSEITKYVMERESVPANPRFVTESDVEDLLKKVL